MYGFNGQRHVEYAQQQSQQPNMGFNGQRNVEYYNNGLIHLGEEESQQLGAQQYSVEMSTNDDNIKYYYKGKIVSSEIQGMAAEGGEGGNKQQSQQLQGSTANNNESSRLNSLIEETAEVASELYGSPSLLHEDLDVVSGKQVILRPRLNNEEKKPPPLGSSGGGNTNDGGNEPLVYYYDPAALQSSSSTFSNNGGGGNSEEELETPELTLPEVVYDESGRSLKLEQVHNGGKNEVFLEVQPRAVWGSNPNFNSGGVGRSNGRGAAVLSERFNSLQAKLQFNNNNGGSFGGGGPGIQSQDQLIVLFTIATMAVMVGALSAQRLRSKRLLESCMGLDDDEEDDDEWDTSTTRNSIIRGSGIGVGGGGKVRYDKKFDADGPTSPSNSGTSPSSNSSTGLNSGFGALMGGRNSIGHGSTSNYYGTNDGGGLHWRGDMEKFDV